jgi:hypothetical protein
MRRYTALATFAIPSCSDSQNYSDSPTGVPVEAKPRSRTTSSSSTRSQVVGPTIPGTGTRPKASAMPKKSWLVKARQLGHCARPRHELRDKRTRMSRRPSGACSTRWTPTTSASAATSRPASKDIRSAKSRGLDGVKKSKRRTTSRRRQWPSKRPAT